MATQTLTPTAAREVAEQVKGLLLAAGIPDDLMRVSVHEDHRVGDLHQCYIHVEAWAPGPGLATEVDSILAEKAKATAEATGKAVKAKKATPVA